MSKVRVFELAKDLNVSSQDVILRAGQAGIRVVNHLSQVDPEVADQIKQLFSTPSEGEVIEKRVSKTVIRRKRVRGADGGGDAVAESAPPAPPAPIRRRAEAAAAEEEAEVPVRLVSEEATPDVAEPDTTPVAEDLSAAAPSVADEPPVDAPEPPSPVSLTAEVSEPEVLEPVAVEPPAPAVEDPGTSAPATDVAASADTPAPSEDRPSTIRRVGGVRVNPHGRPTDTQAVVVAGPPPGFKPPAPPGSHRPYVGRPSGPPPGRRMTGPGGAGGPGFNAPMPPPSADGRVRGDRERERGMTAAEKDERARKKRTGRVVVDRGRTGGWNPRRGVMEDEMGGRMRRGRKGAKKARGKTQLTTPKAVKRIVRIEDTTTVGELAQAMSVKASELIRTLMKQGVMAGINHVLDFDTATLIAEEFSYTVENTGFDITDYVPEVDEGDGDREYRPPVVTVMGHVDHGKTSLLDYIRKSRVADKEAGGITQHIGAYSVQVNDRRVVFLDTPGHEAFTEMRARGAQVTDIVILVVAADDGVMPQTIEAIHHARAADVPIVVAVTKIDKNNAQPDKVLTQLAEHGLQSISWGGETEVVQVSSHTGDGIDDLLEILALQADVLELVANPNRPAQGVVIEARLDKGRGPVASIIVQEGTLRVGDFVVTGQMYGRVRAMLDDSGKNFIKEALPATPVQILGLNGVPNASDPIFVVEDEKKARTVAEHRAAKEREKDLGKTSRVSLEDLFTQISAGEMQELRVVVKADVHGSVEAIKGALVGIKHPQVQVKIIHDAVGGVSESDVNLANVSSGLVIGFNVRASASAKMLAEQEGIEIKTYTVIYDMVDDVKKAMEGLLAPTIEERELGRAEVRQTFSVPKQGTIAGCMVVGGQIRRNARVRLYRDDVLVWSGGIASLRRFKNDVREVAEGYECGIRLENYNDVKEGDMIEAYETVEVAQKLE